MSAQYRKFLNLLEKWPVDKSRPGRDLGEYLRAQLKSILGQPNIVRVNEKKLDRQVLALERLTNNEIQKKYPRRLESTASGLTGEQCRQVLSQEFLDHLNREEEPGLFTKLFRKRSD
ncbi:ubiquinol-cytochrome c reductase complex assembly factor 2 [Culicoides brevitarsis]|uniref:ubiquinol-cytochrome c reductase complex assembly factor 2 n=1 Tax=Culicoides brevitarsis TaxID=469753 RepID=UPI00307BB9FF